jgi:hypothetical protein
VVHMTKKVTTGVMDTGKEAPSPVEARTTRKMRPVAFSPPSLTPNVPPLWEKGVNHEHAHAGAVGGWGGR